MPRIFNGPHRLRPHSKAADDDAMYHGGIVRVPGPYHNESEADFQRVVQAFADSIDQGLALLENGAEFGPDVEPVPNAPVETFDVFDVETGDHLMIWRVRCRERSKQAN